MTMVGGFDVHRKQITFDYVNDDGVVCWGQIRPGTRKTLRRWLGEHCPGGGAEFASQLVGFAKRQAGCAALQHHYGVGWLCAAIIWAEIGDVRRFSSSDQLVRFAGLDVTVYCSDAKRSPGHLSRQGCPQLRWAAFEAARCAARRSSADYAYYRKLAGKHDGHNGKNPTLAVERKILRRSYHTLRELGDGALALPDTPSQEVAA
jgi:transposase